LTLSVRLVSSFKNIIIVCADTYRSKIEKTDRSTASVFSDAASATWISTRPSLRIRAESHYCDGSGGQFLYHEIPNGPSKHLHMSGADVFLFAKSVIPREVESLLELTELESKDLDFAFFHQASQLVLDTLSYRFNQIKCIPNNLKSIGNTTSSSIPILVSSFLSSIDESLFLMSGFGVGLSASSIVVEPA
jgi:3-oxoacyl-[acyl-carrier-protein] synthase-3